MEKIHWWSSGAAQVQLLNQASEDLERLQQDQADAGEQIRMLFHLDREQGREIARLQSVIAALVDMLLAAGIVDEKALIERMQQAADRSGLDEELDLHGR